MGPSIRPRGGTVERHAQQHEQHFGIFRQWQQLGAVYVSDNGGSWTSWITGTTNTSSTFNGVDGHTYGFYSVSHDFVGNVENPPAVADATTTVLLPPLISSWQSNTTVVRTIGPAPFPVTLNIDALHATAYQWQFQNVEIPNATNSSYTIADAHRTNSGMYSVTLTGPGGSVATNGWLEVMVPQRLQPPVRLANGTIRLRFGDDDGGWPTDLSRLESLVTTHLAPPIVWVTNRTGMIITNGHIQFDDLVNTNSPAAYYRAIEKLIADPP